MSTTVGDLVRAPDLGLELLVTGDLERNVRWVHVTELADASPYLVRDEFVLTAGVWRGRGTSALDFVRALDSRHIAGIGYGLLDDGEPVPPALVRACRALGVTLAVVPVRTPFVAVSTWFVDRLTADREEAVRGTLQLAQDLLEVADDDTAPGGDALRQVARLIRRTVGSEIFIADARGHVLAGTLAATVTATSAHPPLPTEDELRAVARRRPAGPGATEELEGWTLYPIAAGGRRVALVGVGAPASGGAPAPAGPQAQDAADGRLLIRSRIETALPVVGLVLARRRALRESERRQAGEVVSLVLSRQFESARARLRVYGLDPNGALVAVVLAVGDRDHDLAAAEEWLEREGHNAIVTIRGDDLHVVIELGRPAGAQTDAASRIGRALTQHTGLRAAGIGEVAAGVDALRRSLVQAQQGCELGRRRGAVVAHDQIGSHALLLALQDQDIIDTFQELLIGPIERYDSRHGTALVATLRTFLQLDGRWQPAADALNVHVNTLRQRLARVEALTGRSLERTPDRVDLWLALQVTAAAGAPIAPTTS
jgi:purine catabolism regulator